MGISTSGAGKLSFGLAAFIGALSGLLIGPTTTIFYDSGFLIGLKGFVAAIFGGLASYPAAALGALLVGVLESFGSFYASAFKEVIVFTLIIPVLLWRSFQHGHDDEEEAVSLAPHRRSSSSRSLLALVPVLAPVARVLDHAGQLHRPLHAGRDRPGAAHRHRRPDVVRPGGVRRHRRVHRGVPDAHATASRRGSRSGSAWSSPAIAALVLGLDHAAHVGPLPAAGDDRLGPGAVLPARQPRLPRQVRRPARHPGAVVLRHRAQHRAQLLLPALDPRRAGRGRGHATCSIRAPAAPCARSRAARRWPRRWASTPSASRSRPSSSRRCWRASRAGCSRTSSAPSTRRRSASTWASSTCSWRCSAASATSGARSSAPASSRS